MVDLARTLGVRWLYAICDVDHLTSARVLEKGGFSREARLRRGAVFPNLQTDRPADVFRYVLDLAGR